MLPSKMPIYCATTPADFAGRSLGSAREVLGRDARSLDPVLANVLGYGYWGYPSKTGLTPYTRLLFSVLGVTEGATPWETERELHLPPSPWTGSSS